MEGKLEEEQAGFRPGRQTQDHIFILRTMMGKMLDKNKRIYLAFLDLKAAFDSLPRKYLWEALPKEVPKELIKAIRSVYKVVKGIVRIEGNESKELQIEKGIKQGDSLINVMDEITKICKRRTTRIQIGYWNMRVIQLQVLLYADDIVLIASSEENLPRSVIEW